MQIDWLAFSDQSEQQLAAQKFQTSAKIGRMDSF
jgi:hypothetical protein